MSQDTTKTKDKISISGGADLYTKYLYRGSLYSNSFNTQPWITTTYKNFEFGTFGVMSIDGYNEVDLYVGYNPLDYFKLRVIEIIRI
jgi:hypothetical protein